MKLSFEAAELNDFEQSSRREWLEPNGLGGWASSTISGAHTRRYHGLLVAATRPPAGRMVLLSRLDETLVVAGGRFALGANRFPGAIHPRGFEHLKKFEKDLLPAWEYEAGGVRLRKTVCAVHGENTTVVLYDVLAAPGPFTLELRPFVAARDDHGLTQANGFLDPAAHFEEGIFRARPYDGVPEVFLALPRAAFLPQPDWWRGFEYERERERGLDAHEDLFTHGTFLRELKAGDRFGVIASTASPAGRDAALLVELERARRAALVAGIPAGDALRRALVLSADAFVVRRGESLRTIVAGYPWFSDWGRDTMIALPGLVLASGRHADAKKILHAFALGASQGMLPNRYPDAGDQPEYDTADATLWFFVAVHEYLQATGDEAFVLGEILPVLREIVAWHDRGTRFGIRVDADGLLRAGEAGVPLTWMDARVGDRAVTPRHGKAVEINALWHNALAILADLERRSGEVAVAKKLAARAAQVKERFAEVFWNDAAGYLFDVVDGDRRDASIRPNAIFALSLPHALLDRERSRRVLKVVEDQLLTPVGLRSLAPDDPAYRPVYAGSPAERDGAYHQGSVWSWLLGPYATALVKVMGAPGKSKAKKLLEGTLPQLTEAGLGHVSEIFDGQAPHAPRGCFAQAWSTGEILRAWAALGAEAAETAVTAEVKPVKKKTYRIVAVAAKGEPKAAKPKAAPKKRGKPPEAEA
jgi:predicted glycogen debranching enzyme